MTTIRDILVAIKSVKARGIQAFQQGNSEEFSKLMGDLLALENCLVTECEKMVLDNDTIEIVLSKTKNIRQAA